MQEKTDRMPKVLVIATSRKTHGGITSVLQMIRHTALWKKYGCYWLSTHRDSSSIVKTAYFLRAFVLFLIILPFYDVVHINFSFGFSLHRKYLLFWIAKFFQKKTVIHLHCGNQLEQYWDKEYDYMFRNANRAIVLSQGIKDTVLSKIGTEYSEKIKVLYNPCPDIKVTSKGDSTNILFLGRIVKEKGYMELIKAFSSIYKRHPEWTLTLCGSGEIKTARDLCIEYKCKDAVFFPGWISDDEKNQYLSYSSILCLPSYAEGFPICILEAWSASVPVIATPVGAVPELLQDGVTGLFVRPADVKSLEDAIEKLIMEPEFRKTLSENAGYLAKTKLSEEVFISSLDRIYSSVVSSK